VAKYTIEIRKVSSGVFELSIPQELYLRLKEAADLAGADSIGSFVLESLWHARALRPTRLAETSHTR
jgi:hypothetical protein